MENLPGRFRPEPSQLAQPENPQPPQEGGNGSPGLPPTIHERAKPPPESQERQPLPSVWDYLERRTRIHEERSSARMTSGEYYCERGELNRIEEQLIERGTARDNLILDLHFSTTKEPASLPILLWQRELSLEEYQQFRSKVDPLSEDEIREEIRKAEEEWELKRSQAYPGLRPPPPDSAISV